MAPGSLASPEDVRMKISDVADDENIVHMTTFTFTLNDRVDNYVQPASFPVHGPLSSPLPTPPPGPLLFPSQRDSNAELLCFPCCLPEQAVK